MAVTATHLTTGQTSADGISAASASITPSSGKLILAFVGNRKGTGGDPITSVTGCGVTWVQVATLLANVGRVSVWRAMGTPTTGTVTFSCGSGNTQVAWAWSIVEFDGVDTSGTNGSGAIVQSATNTQAAVTSLTVTLAAFAQPANATVGGFYLDNLNEAITEGSGFTELGEAGTTTPTTRLQSEWKASNDTSVDASWTTSGRGAGIGLEIKAAPGPVDPGGIASSEAVGSPAIAAALVSGGIASGEALGTSALTAEITPGGVASSETVDAPALLAPIDPTGIASAETVGTPQTLGALDPASIASAEALGEPEVLAATGALLPPGIPSGEAVGTPTLAALVDAVGIASTETFGALAVLAVLVAGGIPTAETLGTPTVGSAVPREPRGTTHTTAADDGSTDALPISTRTSTSSNSGRTGAVITNEP